jgi:hypothetical protein
MTQETINSHLVQEAPLETKMARRSLLIGSAN